MTPANTCTGETPFSTSSFAMSMIRSLMRSASFHSGKSACGTGSPFGLASFLLLPRENLRGQVEHAAPGHYIAGPGPEQADSSMLGEHFDDDLALLPSVARDLVGDEAETAFALGDFPHSSLQIFCRASSTCSSACFHQIVSSRRPIS